MISQTPTGSARQPSVMRLALIAEAGDGLSYSELVKLVQRRFTQSFSPHQSLRRILQVSGKTTNAR
jgi:hypothetical protein